MEQKNLKEIKEKVDLKELDNLPENIEDIENNPILKPLLEFHKQATMLEKEDKIEANFLKEIKDNIKEDLNSGIYDNSNIAKKYQNLEREYERLLLIYSRYTDLADEKIVELKKIVDKYYITKKENQKIVEGLKIKKSEEIPDKDVKKEKIVNKLDDEEIEDDYDSFLKRKGVKK